MSVIVKDVEMPENCIRCPFAENVPPGRTRCRITCRLLAEEYKAPSPERNEYCPLVALPDKHGRLVDADEILGRMESVFNTSSHLVIGHTWGEAYAGGFSDAIDIVKEAPTIVEAEDGS